MRDNVADLARKLANNLVDRRVQDSDCLEILELMDNRKKRVIERAVNWNMCNPVLLTDVKTGLMTLNA